MGVGFIDPTIADFTAKLDRVDAAGDRVAERGERVLGKSGGEPQTGE